MYDITQDWESLAKNFNSITAEVVVNKILLKLVIYISVMRYLNKRAFYFTKITKNNKQMDKEVEIIANSKEEIKIKKAFYKE